MIIQKVRLLVLNHTHTIVLTYEEAPIHLQLAEAYYFPRLHELREAILEEEQKFKCVPP